MNEGVRNSEKTDRIGLFGGTFNPIHYGHLRAAEEVREHLNLSKIIFIPAHIPPHKNGEAMTAAAHRLQMVHRAIKNNPFFTASDFEITQSRTSYSIYTVEHFQNTFDPQAALFFIMGMDSFREITTWKEYARLFSLINFVVMSRPGSPNPDPLNALPVDVIKNFVYNSKERYFEHALGRRIYFQEITLLDISSRAIRDQLKEDRSVRYALPPEVEDYIRTHNLFRP